MNKRVLVKGFDGDMWTGVIVEMNGDTFVIRSDEDDSLIPVHSSQVKFR
jgi:hypothetical protein